MVPVNVNDRLYEAFTLDEEGNVAIRLKIIAGGVGELPPNLQDRIYQMFGLDGSGNVAVNAVVTEGGGASADATYITVDDETGDLPNSRQLVAGDNITLDDAAPGQLVVNAAGGSAGLATFLFGNGVDGDITVDSDDFFWPNPALYPDWEAETVYAIGDRVVDTGHSGQVFQALLPGRSSDSEPSWSIPSNRPRGQKRYEDGGVVWTNATVIQSNVIIGDLFADTLVIEVGRSLWTLEPAASPNIENASVVYGKTLVEIQGSLLVTGDHEQDSIRTTYSTDADLSLYIGTGSGGSGGRGVDDPGQLGDVQGVGNAHDQRGVFGGLPSMLLFGRPADTSVYPLPAMGGAGGAGGLSGGDKGYGSPPIFVLAKSVIVGAAGVVQSRGSDGNAASDGDMRGGGGGGGAGGVYVITQSYINDGVVAGVGGTGGAGGTVSFAITAANPDPVNNFIISGNIETTYCASLILINGGTFTVTGSTANDGTYTIATCSDMGGNTHITVNETVVSAIGDGDINMTGGSGQNGGNGPVEIILV